MVGRIVDRIVVGIPPKTIRNPFVTHPQPIRKQSVNHP